MPPMHIMRLIAFYSVTTIVQCICKDGVRIYERAGDYQQNEG